MAIEKLETDVEIKASPQQFHDVFWNRPHHISNIANDKIQACELHEGDWGTVGSVMCCSYFHDGKAKMVKEIVEAVDADKNLISFRMIEGDLMEEFKTFVATIQCSGKSDGEGSIVHWTMEYERLHDAVPHPETLLQFTTDLSKDIDAHLTQGN